MILLVGQLFAAELPDFEAAPIDGARFEPNLGDRMLVVQDAQPLTEGGMEFGAVGHWTHRPYTWVDRETAEETDVLEHVNGVVLGGAFWRGRTRVGLDVPVILGTRGLSDGRLGAGDARLNGRFTLIPGGEETIGLALSATAGLPLGTTQRQIASVGGWGRIGLAGDYRVGPALGAVNVGYRFLPDSALHDSLTWGDQVDFGVGLAWALHPQFDLSAELAGTTQVDNALGLGQGTPIEAIVASRITTPQGITIRLGGGRGLTDGVGAPDLRLLAGISWGPPEEIPDRDQDGIRDEDDACIDEPEDADGYADRDGCPDWDDDDDGLLDTEDACRFEPEDHDGYLDEDGCPDANARLLLSIEDWGARPVEADSVRLVGPDTEHTFERVTEVDVQLGAGSWELHVQAPGRTPWFETLHVPDEGDLPWVAAPIEPGPRGLVLLESTDADGEPIDAQVLIDGDLRPVLVHEGRPALRLEPGAHDLVVQGPGLFPVRVEVEVEDLEELTLPVTLYAELVTMGDDQLDLAEGVDFLPNTSDLVLASRTLLDQVAATLQEHPEIRLLRIEGHTDAQGTDLGNLKLSQERADAVARYLIQSGVAPDRIYAVGFGEDFPIADNDTPEGRAANRRVGFFIEERR
ncbi:MAG: OmpA family protein [Proteobacteria bacterium]|nr:OmpA family protein [Pseudomonadota bacterium]